MGKPKILLVYPYIEDFAAYDHFAKPLGLWLLADRLQSVADIAYINALDRSIQELGLKFRPDGTGHFFHQVIPTPPQLSDIPRRWRRYGMPEEMFLRFLHDLPWKPEWIFVSSGMTYWYTGLRYTIRLLREVFPLSRIVLGGIYASLLPEHAKTMGADYVVPFQEPAQVCDMLSALLGVSVPFAGMAPDYTLTREYAYAPLLLALGCVFRCHYCASPRLSSFLPLDMERTKAAFDFLYERGVRHFAFYDDALLFEWQKRLLVFLSHVLEKGYQPFFHTPNGLHICFLTKEVASLLFQAGFHDVRLSLESADEEFQKEHGGKAKREEFLQAMEALYEGGFQRHHIRVYALVNVPGQTLSSVEKTMEFIYEAGGLPMLAYYSPIPGTPDFLLASSRVDLHDPLYHNNTVYLYRSGIDREYVQYLHTREIEYRHAAEKNQG